MNWFFRTNIKKVIRDASGGFFYSTFGGKKEDFTISSYKELIFKSPALLKVFKIICENGSLCNINLYSNGKLKDENFLYKIKNNPNPYQTWTDFIYDYFFYISIGNVYYYVERSDLSKDNNVYFLDPERIEFLNKRKKSLVFDNLGFKKNRKEEVFYYLETDDTKRILSLNNLYIISDLTNYNGNDYRNNLDALAGVVSNSNKTISTKNVNLQYSSEFFLSNADKNSENITQFTGIGSSEKQSILNSLNSGNNIHITSANLTLQRFVDNFGSLKLDDSFLSDLHIIGNFFGVPKDIIEASANGTTYENQEKSMGRFVDYVLKPKIQKFTDILELIHGFEDVRADWSHLSFMNVFSTENSKRKEIDLQNLKLAKELGLPEKLVEFELNKIYNYEN